jgi:F-type H+-transporting ATPase subunit b
VYYGAYQKFRNRPHSLGRSDRKFLVVLYILRRFLYKPILDTLKKRREKISEGLEVTEEANARLEKITQEEKTILRNAESQVKKLLEDSRKESLEMLRKAEELTKIKTDRLLLEARQQIALETREAGNKLEKKISILAIDFIRKSIPSLFSKNDQEIAMNNVLGKLKKIS